MYKFIIFLFICYTPPKSEYLFWRRVYGSGVLIKHSVCTQTSLFVLFSSIPKDIMKKLLTCLVFEKGRNKVNLLKNEGL